MQRFLLQISILLGLFGVVLLWSPTQAHASSADTFLEQATAGGASAAAATASKQSQKVLSKISSFGSWAKKSGILKKLKLDALSEMFEIGDALLSGDLVEASIQVLGALANLAVEYGVPMLAGTACTAFGTPAAGAVCYRLAKRIVSALDLDELAENWVEGTLRAKRGDSQAGSDAKARSAARQSSGGASVVDQAKIAVKVGDVTTVASGNGGSAVTDIGVVHGGNAQVAVSVDEAVTTTTNQGDAYTGIGVVEGGKSRVNVNLDGGVTTNARGSSSASTEIGIANGGDVQVQVKSDVVTQASGHGSAQTQIGSSSGGSVTASVKGSVVTQANSGGNTSTSIGANNSAHIKGDVINQGGSLSVGGACEARRNGQCCIDVHRGYCVLTKTPTHKGSCPPRFERDGGICYLYSDKKHKL